MSIIVGPLALLLLVGASALFILGHKAAPRVLLAAVLLAIVGSFVPKSGAFAPLVEAASTATVLLVPLLLLAALMRVLIPSKRRRDRQTSMKRRVESD